MANRVNQASSEDLSIGRDLWQEDAAEAFPGGVAARVRVGDISLNMLDAGTGEPVLLLHGFPDSLTVWRAVAPQLIAVGYRVIAFDQRGFGDSDAPAGVANYKVAAMVADITRLLDVLAVRGPVHVMGHDWGAVIAWALALAHPQRVRDVVAISVGHPQAYGRAGFEQKFGKGLYTLGFQLRGLAEAWFLRNRARGLRNWLASRHPDPEAVVSAMSRPGRLTAGMNWYRANLVDVLFGAWPRCTVPVLGMWSSGDRYLTEAQMTNSARLVDAAWEYRRVENCGHWIPLECPGAVLAAARAWFARHPLAE